MSGLSNRNQSGKNKETSEEYRSVNKLDSDEMELFREVIVSGLFNVYWMISRNSQIALEPF